MGDAVHAFAVPFHPASVGQARALLREWLRPAAATTPLVEDAALVVSELVTNAIRHARPTAANEVGVEMRLVDRQLHLAVTDGGGDSIPHQVGTAAVAPGGRGLAIVSGLADRWWWESVDQGCTVHAVLRWPADSV